VLGARYKLEKSDSHYLTALLSRRRKEWLSPFNASSRSPCSWIPDQVRDDAVLGEFETPPFSRQKLISKKLEISLTAASAAVISMNMETTSATSSATAVAALSALALFRLLVQAGEGGMAAGAIAGALGIPNSSLSFHLAQLSRAGLIRQERRHRSLIYSADYPAMNALIGYLMENCCAGAGCGDDAACLPGADRAKKEMA